MPSLPVVGDSSGTWGTDLNNWLTATQVHAVHADASSGGLTNFTTESDIPGASISVTCANSSSTVLVLGTFDFEVDTTSAAIIGYLNWNGGSDQAQQVVMNGPVNSRQLLTGVWLITGVSAGTYTAKLRASFSGVSGKGSVRATHTGITAVVLEGPS